MLFISGNQAVELIRQSKPVGMWVFMRVTQAGKTGG